MNNKNLLITIALILNSFFLTPSWAAVKDVSFLGMKLLEQDLNGVRNQLWNIGGFLQDPSTTKQRNIDKFFTWSNIRDSYYVEFRYDNAGKVASAMRLYRPESILNANKRTPIETRDIALEIIAQIGQPTQVIRKGWGGSPSYRSYIWKDDELTVIVDREGSEIYGNVFVKYIVNKVDPYFVEPKDKKP